MLKQESLRRENRGKTYDLCMRIDKMMRRIDPYQHHGIHFVHEKELLSFPDLYLPVDLLADAKCLLGSADIKIKKVDSEMEVALNGKKQVIISIDALKLNKRSSETIATILLK